MIRPRGSFLAAAIAAGTLLGALGCPDSGAPAFPGIDPQRMLDDVTALAAAGMTGRETATPGNDRALAFIAGRFEDLGLRPGGDGGTFLRRFDFPRWEMTEAPELALDGTLRTYPDDYLVYRYAASGDVTGAVVFVGYGVVVPPFDAADHPECPLSPAGYDDYGGLDVTGAVLLRMRGLPADDGRIAVRCPMRGKDAVAAERGAAAVLALPGFRDAPEPLAGVFTDPDAPVAIPVLMLDRTLAESLVPGLASSASAIDAGGGPAAFATALTARVRVAARTETVDAFNVVGVLEGRDPVLRDEVVVVGAHVDHLGTDSWSGLTYPGADDNASGTAMMLELARLVTAGAAPPVRTVVFAAWNGEEQGTIGSCAWTANPTLPIGAVVAAINLDQVGGGDASGIRLVGAGEPVNRPLTDLLLDSALERGVPGTVHPLPYSTTTDHRCFAEAGVPILSVSSAGPHPHAHTPQDDVSTILLEDLRVTADFVRAALEPLAAGTD